MTATVLEVDRQIKQLLGQLTLTNLMPTAPRMRIGSFQPRITYFLSGRDSWKISTGQKRRTLTRISYLHDVSKLLKTWLPSRSSASQPVEASESTGMSMTIMKLRSRKNPRLPKGIHWNVLQMFALSVAVNLNFHRLILLHTDFPPSGKIHSVVISLSLISPMRMTESAARGQRAMESLSSLKSLNFLAHAVTACV
jgi:hypothetical protein